MIVGLTAAPHIREVLPESPEFQSALAKAGAILAGTNLNVHSRHHHYKMKNTEVLFEESVTPKELALYPLPEKEAAEKGLPSCWGFESDGTAVVLRYADKLLHQRSDLDVTSKQFLAKLSAVGKAFASQGLQEILELTVIEQLFPIREDQVTLEETNEAQRIQKITVITPTSEMNRDSATAASWRFTHEGEPIAKGYCEPIKGGH